MALQTSGQISMSDINVELGNSSTALISLNDTAVRDLAGIPSGQISLSDFYGASAGGWNISTTSYVQFFSVFNQETNPTGVHFSPDGTNMYICGSIGDDINQYSLSTPWNISTASYVRNFSVAAQDTQPQAVFFKPDGTQMFVLGGSGTDVITYSLSTAWNISTASYVRNFFLFGNFEERPTGLFFSDDGTRMYVSSENDDIIQQYTVTSAWLVSSQHMIAETIWPVTSPTGVWFKPDGTKMFVIDSAENVEEYNLSTPWSITSASFAQQYSIASQDTAMAGIFFRENGTKMYTVGQNHDRVYEYNVSA